MNVDDSTDPPAAPKWSRMPGATRVRLDQAIAEHLREHGPRHYDLLRRSAEFSAWIGDHLGSRGEKRLDRYISEVKHHEAKRSRRQYAGYSHQPLSSIGQTSTEDRPGTFSDASAPALSYEELQGFTRRSLRLLDSAIADCLREDGRVEDPALLLKLHREQRETIKASADLAKRLSDHLRESAVSDQIVARAVQECSNDPARERALADDLNQIILRAGGLALAGEH